MVPERENPEKVISQRGKPLWITVVNLKGVQHVNSSGQSLGNSVARKIVTDVVGDTQVRADLDLWRKTGHVPNGGMEYQAKGLAHSVKGCLTGVRGAFRGTGLHSCLVGQRPSSLGTHHTLATSNVPSRPLRT